MTSAMNVFRLLIGLILATPLMLSAMASEQFVDFNIPAMSLERALEAFGAVTKEQLLLDTSMIDGHRSNPVSGRFAPEAALRQMLARTGLAVRPIAGQGYAVVPASTIKQAVMQGAVSSSAYRFNSYSALIQSALGRALCERTDTAPGTYRAMARLWIGSTGTIDKAELLTSSGDAARDVMLTARLHGLPIGAPPADLPQPVTLLVTSEGASKNYCAKYDAAPVGISAMAR